MTSRGLHEGLLSQGVGAALIAAALFGLGTPLAKMLLASIDPWLLAGLLYAGSGIVLTLVRWVRPKARGTLTRAELGNFIAAIVAGGVIGPVLLMRGLAAMPAAGASLLLNAEGVFTALIAWIVFRENVDRRIALGMLAIVAGAILLTYEPGVYLQDLWPALLVLGACLAWAIDNNLTRKLSLYDATWIASIKGLVAGATNLSIALLLGARWPSAVGTLSAMAIGALAYGASLVLFVTGLRHLGAARTTAYFSIAPFVGATVSVIAFHEAISLQLVFAALLMIFGVWLHVTERHEHLHQHAPIEHEHEHEHDEHHQHVHADGIDTARAHTHWHRHEPMTHSHHHFPDTHHQHEHR